MHLRLAVPTNAELTVMNALVGAAQFAFLGAAVLASRRKAAPLPASAPKAVVVAACKGAPPGLEQNAAALLAQDYPGPVDYLFVLPSESDPGWEPVSAAARAARAAGTRVRVLATGVVPRRSSGKAADLAWSLGALPDDAVLAVFTEVDVSVGPGWLRALTAPLADPAVGVATSLAVPVPPTLGAWGLLRMVWCAVGIPYFSALGMVCGQGMAVRAADLGRWGLRAAWERCFADDLALRDCARASGAGVRFVYQAMGVQNTSCRRGEFWAVFNRWWMTFRVYEPLLFVLSFLLVGFKVYSLSRGLAALPHPTLLGVALAADFAYYAAVLAWLARQAPASFAALPGGAFGRLAAAGAAAAALPWVYAAHFAASLGPARVRWGDRTYVLRGRLDVVAEPRAGEGPALP